MDAFVFAVLMLPSHNTATRFIGSRVSSDFSLLFTWDDTKHDDMLSKTLSWFLDQASVEYAGRAC